MNLYQKKVCAVVFQFFLLLLFLVQQSFSQSFLQESAVRTCETQMDQKKAQELRNWIDKSGFTKGNRQILVLAIQFPGSPAEAEISSVDSLMNIHTLAGGSGKGTIRKIRRLI